MAEWVKLCAVADAPAAGEVMEADAGGVGICLANVGGELSALANSCPHRGAPLGQGWVDGETVVCPWHSWSFNAKTGVADFPPGQRVATFPLRVAGDDVLVEIGHGGNQAGNIEQLDEDL